MKIVPKIHGPILSLAATLSERAVTFSPHFLFIESHAIVKFSNLHVTCWTTLHIYHIKFSYVRASKEHCTIANHVRVAE